MTQAEAKEFKALPRERQEFLVKREAARELCRKSLYYLGKEILGYKDFCSSQVEWDKWVREKIDLTGNTSGKFLILQPRETYKTTFFNITLVINLLLNNPELSIMIANERYENARDILREIKRHFEQNEKLRSLFGNYVSPTTWAENSITLNRKTKNVKEPSVWISGIGAAVTSKHPDVIVCDDIAGRKDKESEVGRHQTHIFFQDCWDLLKKDTGIFIMLGTRKHMFDIYHHIKNKLNPALEQEGMQKFEILEMPAHKPDGTLNFPRILTEEKLRELRVVKTDSDGIDFSTYSAEYELNPLDEKDQVFKQFTFVNHEGMKFDKISQWTDPSLGETKDSDFSAIITVARIAEGEHKGKYICIGADIDKRSPTQIIKTHNQTYRETYKLHPDIEYQVAIEQNGFAGLRDYARADSLQDKDEIPVPTRAVANTENKDIRIKSMEPAVTTGMLVFREDWLTAPGNYKLLIEQLRNYPQSKKDGPDALQCAYKQINKRGPSIR
jgi:predicted phage terminase large subunit-like protein